jgi:HAD superfamily hydrolase (TIGR01490 family)
MPQTIAFFDMDHTVLRDSSGVLYMRYLRGRGEVSRWSLLRSYWYAALYKIGWFDYPAVAVKLAQTAFDQDEAETRVLCQRFFDELMVQYVAEEAVQRMREHRAQGHLVTLITASTPYVAGPVAAHLGIEEYLCTRMEVVDGRFTGRVHLPSCYGADKVNYAQAFAIRHGGDLAGAYFYSDSLSDLPLLEAVGHPVAVNPDPRLKRLAVVRGWPIERFR